MVNWYAKLFGRYRTAMEGTGLPFKWNEDTRKRMLQANSSQEYRQFCEILFSGFMFQEWITRRVRHKNFHDSMYFTLNRSREKKRTPWFVM